MRFSSLCCSPSPISARAAWLRAPLQRLRPRTPPPRQLWSPECSLGAARPARRPASRSPTGAGPR
eukprot:9565457-Alexandrium_andersonii.AAC.1